MNNTTATTTTTATATATATTTTTTTTTSESRGVRWAGWVVGSRPFEGGGHVFGSNYC